MSLRTRLGAVVALLVAGMLALVWAYNYGGGSNPGLLDRAGLAVTWGLPAAKLVVNLASTGTIGALVLALFALPRGETAYVTALRFAAWSAAAWSCGAAIHLYASFLLIVNSAPSTAHAEAFLTYLTKIDAGRAGALTTLVAGGVAVCCFRLRSSRLLVLTVAAAFAGLLPMVLKSHAAGGIGHADSTTAIFLHAAAASVWVGGLLSLVMLRRVLPALQLGVVVRRYSTLALICFISLAATGLLGALGRINTVAGLLSPYGVIILAKVGVLVILGGLGALHRRWSIGRLEKDPGRGGRQFAALAVGELAAMGAASGMAVALARTEPPNNTVAGDAGTGQLDAGGLDTALPVPDLWEYISGWAPDPFWILACAFGVAAYLAGVRRLRAAGRAWPVYRTVLWLAGVGVLFVVTNGGVHVYQGYLFNAHVLTQMMLTAVVPLLLVPAAPVTLAQLAVKERTDGSTGVREFMEQTMQPWLAALQKDPALTIFVLAGSLFAIYYSPLLEWAAVGQFGYSVMSLIALLSGCLATVALTREPGTGSLSSNRLLVLVAMAALYAFGGWKVMEQAPALQLPWDTAVGQPWGQSAFAAAELGGPLMWSIAAVSLGITAAMVLTRRRQPPAGVTEHGHEELALP